MIKNTESTQSQRSEETGQAPWAITPLEKLTYAGDPKYAAEFFKTQRWHEDLGIGVKKKSAHTATQDYEN